MKKEYNPFKGASVVSLIIIAFALIFHATTVTPTDFSRVFMWLPIFISPAWIISGGVYFNNRRKN